MGHFSERHSLNEATPSRRFNTLRFLKRLVVATVLVGAFMVATQDLQVFPSTLPRLVGADPGTPPTGVTESFVETSDGVRVRVWETAADGAVRKVALLLHGNADSLPGTSGLRALLARHGISTASFDYRGTGSSSGWPSEEGIYRDGEAVMNALLTKHGIPADAMAIIGISVGTGPASFLAQRYNVGRLILVSPYFSIRDVVAEMPLYGFLVPFFKYHFPTAEYLSRTAGTRITLFHGAKDSTIPVSHAERIVQHLPSSVPCEFIRIEQAGHNDILGFVSNQLIERLLQ